MNMWLKILCVITMVFVCSHCSKESVVNKSVDDTENLRKQYKMAIATEISTHWRKPLNVDGNALCTVNIDQNRLGEVLQVEVESTDQCDAEMSKSVERAVFLASPLPIADNYDSRLFDRKLTLSFVPR